MPNDILQVGPLHRGRINTVHDFQNLPLVDPLDAFNQVGTSAADTLDVKKFSSMVSALECNDTINLPSGINNGNYWIDGGAGTDTVVVATLFTHYKLVSYGGDLLLQSLDGSEGASLLRSVEEIQFADGRKVYDQGDAAAIAYRMYDSAFGRAPDSKGLNDWTTKLQNGLSVADMASGFVASHEFVATYGPLNNQQFVDQLYQNLDREGEEAGVAGWTNALNTNAISRGQVLAAFSESNEHVLKLAPAVSGGIWDVNETSASLARLYGAAFDRLPDSGGLLGWKSAVDNGMSLSSCSRLNFRTRMATSAITSTSNSSISTL